MGIEPASNTAKVAKDKGIETIEEFFGNSLAKKLSLQGIKADLLIGNNVIAHVPDVNDFVSGMKMILNEKGIITMEFPHLTNIIEKNEFDTVYHEHYSYFSLNTIKKIFEKFGLEIFDVEEIPTHGGSLRIYAKHLADKTKNVSANINNLLMKEESIGLKNIIYYKKYKDKIEKIKYELVSFLLEQKKMEKKLLHMAQRPRGILYLIIAE